MNQDVVIDLVTQAMEIGFFVAGPILAVGLVVGLVVSVFQAVTQIQEQTLTFVPKLVGLAIVLVVVGPWMLGMMTSWTAELWRDIPSYVDGG